MKTYFVKTQDVDHNGPARKYAKLENAVARFEEMVGFSVENAIAEHYYAANPTPKIEEVTRLRGVSMFGTVVTFWVVEKTDEELAYEKDLRELRAASRARKLADPATVERVLTAQLASNQSKP